MIDREKIKKDLQAASWINKDSDELQERKLCLRYLRKLGRTLKGNQPPNTVGENNEDLDVTLNEP
jgi:hypothetical protein